MKKFNEKRKVKQGKRGMLTLFLIAVLCSIQMLLAVNVYGQQLITVSGTVTNESGEPLPGATVMIKGTTKGTVTNTDGNYTIDANSDATLVFSFIGYQTQEVEINGRNTININFTQSSIGLDEVVAIGYGQRTRANLTGAIGNTTGRELEKTATPNMRQALQGKVAGLIVRDAGGAPGDPDLDILIRGKHTLGNNNPLIVIDGVPGGSWEYLSANDIESVSVLKDASAAIYGARSANGVILIQTKKSSKYQSPVFKLQTEYGIQQTTNRNKRLSSFQLATVQNERAQYLGQAPPWTQNDLNLFESGSSPLTHPNTDWYKELINTKAPQSQVNLSVQGGTENVQYFISGNHVYQNGLLKTNDLNFRQSQLISNINVQASKNLQLGTNIRYISGLREEPDQPNPFNSDLLGAEPWIVARWPNGLLGPVGDHGSTLAFADDDLILDRNIKNNELNIQFNYEYDLSWLTDGLKFSGYSSFRRSSSDNKAVRSPYYSYTYNDVTGEYEKHWQDATPTREGGESIEVDVALQNGKEEFHHLRLSFDKNFGDHFLSAFIAHERQAGNSHGASGFRRDLPTKTQPYLWAGSLNQINNNEWESNYGRINYFGSINYNYLSKYMIDLTLRRDGSHIFPKDRRFGTFGGASVGWTISKESFMAGSKGWLDNLKLRASYAKMGNDAVTPFQYLLNYNYVQQYSLGLDDAQVFNVFRPDNEPNPFITWENAYQQNYGFDMTVLKGMFSLSGDVFFEKRRDILENRGAQVPDYVAMRLPDENFAAVDSRGIELSLNYNQNFGDLRVFGGGMITHTTNEVIDRAEPDDVPEWRKQEGKPMDSRVVYLQEGIFKDQAQIDNTPHITGVTIPGDPIYKDVDDDGRITANDRVRLYESNTPRTQFSFNMGAEYKGLELSLFFQGQTNASVAYSGIGLMTPYIFERRWTPENINASYPRSGASNEPSDAYTKDATFLRFKNFTLAYNLPKKWLSDLKISDAQVYLQGRNLMTWDKIKEFDMDPEGGDGVTAYPLTRVFTVGANISF